MLTSNEIKKQIKDGNITISNLKENSFTKPNSCNITLTDELYTFDYKIIDSREGGKYLKEVLEKKPSKLKKVKIPKKGLLLEPGKVYISYTQENVKTNGYVPVFNGKASMSLLGVSIELNSGYCEDKHENKFILSIVCTKPTIIYPNIEIGNLTFFKSLDAKSSTYGMISGEEIKNRIKTKDIIIKPKNNIVINPNSVNLTLNKRIGVYTTPIIDINKQNEIEFIDIPKEGLVLYPNQIYVARTNEWTETDSLVPMMSGRSSLGRLGLHVHCSAGMGSIGYKGYWYLGIRPTMPIKIYEDTKICQIYFMVPEGETDTKYKGYLQNIDKSIDEVFQTLNN